MKTVFENLFDYDNKCDLLIVTTNSYLKTTDMLVMGRGAAKQLVDRRNYLQYEFGKLIKDYCGHLGVYGFLYIESKELRTKYGIFQVKQHFNAPSTLAMVIHSTVKLGFYANEHKDQEIRMNYPAIGYGQLTIEEVEPIVKVLPDNVFLHLYPREV